MSVCLFPLLGLFSISCFITAVHFTRIHPIFPVFPPACLSVVLILTLCLCLSPFLLHSTFFLSSHRCISAEVSVDSSYTVSQHFLPSTGLTNHPPCHISVHLLLLYLVQISQHIMAKMYLAQQYNTFFRPQCFCHVVVIIRTFSGQSEITFFTQSTTFSPSKMFINLKTQHMKQYMKEV